jgi:hypothetical protein
MAIFHGLDFKPKQSVEFNDHISWFTFQAKTINGTQNKTITRIQ